MRRAPGAQTQRVTFGYQSESYYLVQDSLDVPIPREYMHEAKAGPGIDLGKRATNLGMEQVTLGLEIEQAELASNPDNYSGNQKLALAAGDKWSDPASDPERDVREAKESVRRSCGVDPNRMVPSSPIFNARKFHPKNHRKVQIYLGGFADHHHAGQYL